MHVCSPHTRLSALSGCLEWKHSQGWRGKSGKHFFQCKQKNTSWACCYCTVLGRCFVCSDNSRTFKWRPGTEPETRAHHWRWGEKVYRPHWQARHYWPPWLQGQGAGWCVCILQGLCVTLWLCVYECMPVHMTEFVCLQITWISVLPFLKGAGQPNYMATSSSSY